MFNGLHASMPRTEAELASQALTEEGIYRLPSFSSSDAVTLVSDVSERRVDLSLKAKSLQGLSIRKRFRATSRHAKGKGLVISIQTIAGHTLFACTVGDLGHPAGVGDVSMDSWATVENMISVVKRTGHSSYYVEKGMGAMGRNSKQMGLGETRIVGGGLSLAICF
jgi:hypothetical protein